MVRVLGGTRIYSSIPCYSGTIKLTGEMNRKPYDWVTVPRTVFPKANDAECRHVDLQHVLQRYGPPGCTYRQSTVEPTGGWATYFPGSRNRETHLETPGDVAVRKDEADFHVRVVGGEGEGGNAQKSTTCLQAGHSNESEDSDGGQEQTDHTQNMTRCEVIDGMQDKERSHQEKDGSDVVKFCRKTRRRERNRMSAQAYRTRKRDRMSAHEVSLTELEAKNKDLLDAVSYLELERSTFLTMIRARLNINLFTEQDEQPPHTHVDMPLSKDSTGDDMCGVLDLSVPHASGELPANNSTCLGEAPSTTTTRPISWHRPADVMDTHGDVTDTHNVHRNDSHSTFNTSTHIS